MEIILNNENSDLARRGRVTLKKRPFYKNVKNLKAKKPQIFRLEAFDWVAGAGLEPTTFGL